MAFTGTSPANLASYLQDRIVPNALSQLIGKLELFQDIPVVPTDLADINEKTQTVSFPIVGAQAANTRAALDNVVDQALSVSSVTATYTQSESTFVVDSLTDDVMNEQRMNLHTEAAVIAVSKKLITEAYTAISTVGGVTTIGTPATAITYPVFIQPKRELTNVEQADEDRFYHVSPQTMEEIMNFSEYTQLLGFDGRKGDEMLTRLAGFTVRESIYLDPTGGLGNIRNLAFQGRDNLRQVFAPQKPITSAGQVKSTMTAPGGYSISILVEPRQATNGAYGVTVSVNHVAKLVRNSGMVYIEGT